MGWNVNGQVGLLSPLGPFSPLVQYTNFVHYKYDGPFEVLKKVEQSPIN